MADSCIRFWPLVAVLVVTEFMKVSDASACATNTVVGPDPNLNTNAEQTGHGALTTTVLFSNLYTIPCCGVITAWSFRVYDDATDGCSYPCTIDLQVWANQQQFARTATLMGANNGQQVTAASVDANKITRITIPISQQIPVQPGYSLGWNSGLTGIVDYHDLSGSCGGGLPCSAIYLETIPKLNPSIGTTYGFSQVFNSAARFYSIQATVNPGAPPTFTNLPSTDTILNTLSIGSTVRTAVATDPQLKQILTYGISSQSPTGYFSINSASGVITLLQSVVNGPWQFTLNVTVTDGCLTTTQTLIVYVTANTTSTPFFQTSDGVAVLLLLIFILAILLAMALWYLCTRFICPWAGCDCTNCGYMLDE